MSQSLSINLLRDHPEGINVLSLFDGISCGQLALERAGIKVANYYSCEIDNSAVRVAQDNYPGTIQLGDVRGLKGAGLPSIHLLIGGSPCQGFSRAGKMLNFDDPRSRLFFEYVRLKNELQPAYFMMENIRMKQPSKGIISKYLGVNPIEINSALVSAQTRRRFYWTNIPEIAQPEDQGLIFDSVIDYNNKDLSELALTEKQIEFGIYKHKGKIWKSGYRMGNMKFPNATDKKSQCLPATVIRGARETNHIMDNGVIRILSRNECERLQTLPINYTASASLNQAHRLIGNGWTIDVIAHIFSFIH